MKRILSIVCILVLLSCNKKKIDIENYSVVSAREEVSRIGTQIIEKGGSAFDAMIATEFALTVAYPVAGNIGGGGFLVYRLKDGKIGSLDYREMAPAAAYENMYLDVSGNVIKGMSREGIKAIGVPGTVAGMIAVYKKFGTLPINDIIRPVIDLARKGIVVSRKQAKRFKKYNETFKRINGVNSLFSKEYKEGDILKQENLARTFEKIANDFENAFYKGEIANMLVDFVKKRGGLITKNDLKSYKAKWRKPLTFNYKGLRLISMGPPSSGGICMGQMLKMLEPYDLKSFGHNSLKSMQLIVEAERRSFADRSYYLGDPDFVNVPIDSLLNKLYLKNRMQDFTFEKATKSSDISYGNIQWDIESDETTHYSIIDKQGNAVAVTTTLNGAYGSKVYSDELGFFFNNEMDDFSIKPRSPNMFGLLGGIANAVKPHKRMLSSMTPTIVEKNQKLAMVLGSPGGATIITTVLQTFLNVFEYQMDLATAVDAPRFHHQWLPDSVILEPDLFSEKTKENLINKGYHIVEKNSRIIGKIYAIKVDEKGQLQSKVDRRGNDSEN